MSEDKHLGTGEYDPEKYWNARAEASDGDTFQAVCGFGLSKVENAAMEKIQLSVLSSLLKGIDLQNKKIMELGCGVGRLAPWFTNKGALYTGTDISEKMIQIAKARIHDGKFIKLDSVKLPFPSDSFDLVYSVTVLHHNPYERQRKIIDEMVRVTKPGGLILLMEAVSSKKKGSTSFNMFPRTIDGWISEVENDGRAKLVKIRVARWWLLRDVLYKAFRTVSNLVGKAATSPSAEVELNRQKIGTLNTFLVRIGSCVDTYIMWLLPKKYATNAAMLFKKQQAGTHAGNGG